MKSMLTAVLAIGITVGSAYALAANTCFTIPGPFAPGSQLNLLPAAPLQDLIGPDAAKLSRDI